MPKKQLTNVRGEIPQETIANIERVFGIDVDSLPSIEEARKNAANFDALYNEKNPHTGLRYDIPMLKSTDPDYPKRYADMMRIKRKDPMLFDKILNWD